MISELEQQLSKAINLSNQDGASANVNNVDRKDALHKLREIAHFHEMRKYMLDQIAEVESELLIMIPHIREGLGQVNTIQERHESLMILKKSPQTSEVEDEKA